MFSVALDAPSHVDELGLAAGDAEAFSRVATNGQPVIVRRTGEDLAAVVPWQYLELVHDAVARQKAEQISATLDWERLVKNVPPPPEWFDGDEPKPFCGSVRVPSPEALQIGRIVWAEVTDQDGIRKSLFSGRFE